MGNNDDLDQTVVFLDLSDDQTAAPERRCDHDVATGETHAMATVGGGPSRQWLPALMLLVVVGGLFAAQAQLFATESPATADPPALPDLTTTIPDATATTNPPGAGAAASTPMLGPAVNDTHRAQLDGTLPLFPGSPPVLVALRRGTQVHVIDAQTGHKRIATVANTAASTASRGSSIGFADGRLLVLDGNTVRAIALSGGADFDVSGKAVALDTSKRATILLETERFGGSLEIQQSVTPIFRPSGWGLEAPAESEIIAVHTRVLLESSGTLFDPRNSRVAQLGNGTLIGAGVAHVLIETCENAECVLTRIGDDGSIDELDVALAYTDPARYLLSPDGRWAALASVSGYVVFDLDGVAEPMVRGSIGTSSNSFDEAGPLAFTPDSRHVAAIVDGALAITALGEPAAETRRIDISPAANPYDELVIAPRPPR